MSRLPTVAPAPGATCAGCGTRIARDADWCWTEHPEPQHYCEASKGELVDGECRRVADHDGRHRFTGEFERIRVGQHWHADCLPAEHQA